MRSRYGRRGGTHPAAAVLFFTAVLLALAAVETVAHWLPVLVVAAVAMVTLAGLRRWRRQLPPPRVVPGRVVDPDAARAAGAALRAAEETRQLREENAELRRQVAELRDQAAGHVPSPASAREDAAAAHDRLTRDPRSGVRPLFPGEDPCARGAGSEASR